MDSNKPSLDETKAITLPTEPNQFDLIEEVALWSKYACSEQLLRLLQNSTKFICDSKLRLCIKLWWPTFSKVNFENNVINQLHVVLD